jgi:hypothetical protein
MTNINVSLLNGRNGFIIEGAREDGRLGDAVSNAGDFNGDGIPDIIIGALDVDVSGSNSAGQVSIIFGSNENFTSLFSSNENFAGRISVSALDGTSGFRIAGYNDEQRLGISVSRAGDINNDGISDIIIGANGTNDNRGDSYIIFGSESIGDGVDLLALDGTNGFKIDGIIEGNLFGTAVSDAGDINNDGIADLAVTATRVNSNGNEDSGATYVIFGQEGDFPDDLDLTTLDGNNGFVVKGANLNDFSGVSVSDAGDLNGDNIDDLLIGASQVDLGERQDVGATYVVFGRENGFSNEINLSDLGSNGLTINGIAAGDNSGFSVSSLGDINSDGFADIGIGAPNENEGQGYVIFGTGNGFSQDILSLSDLNGTNGFTLNGIDANDLLGTSISSAGDLNNDEIDDFVISASGSNEEAGTSYVIFGRDAGETFGATLNLADLNINQGFSINGISASTRSGESVSDLGDVNQDGIDDLIIGAPQAVPTEDLSNAGEAYVVFGRVENLGDVDNDRAYTNEDVYLISRMAVGLDTEFAAYPGIDPLLVADVNSDGFVSALDSAIVYSTANNTGTSSFILPDIS